MKAYCTACEKIKELKNFKRLILRGGRKAIAGDCNHCGARLFKYIVRYPSRRAGPVEVR